MGVVEDLFAGGGEMGALMRSLDWSQTLLGPVSEWAQSLKTALSIILTSRYPMFIWWGAEYANLYNDAYRPILGASKHPQFLGQSAKNCWADVWDVVGPLADSVLTTGQPTWSEDLLLLMDRNGYLEETYFTFSYSPVRDESGGVGGVFCAVTETTGRIIGERRLRTLRELAAKSAEAKTVEEACHIATKTLSINLHDIPFALLYRVEADGKQADLAGTTGIEAGTVASPQQVDLFHQDLRIRPPSPPNLGETGGQNDCVCLSPVQESEADRWNLARVNRTGKAELVSDLRRRFGVLPKGAWSEEPTEALVIPIAQSGKAQRRGLLVIGINPRREFDDDYQGFFDLIASNVATAIANADAYEAERKRAAALAELDRAKTTFFSNISHEFRTPLTLMLGSVEETLAGNEPLSIHQREQLEVAQRNSLRLLKLVNTLLDFSRIEAGRNQAVYEPTNLATFTRELASVFRSTIERAGMQLVVDCPPLPEPIYVDREMWEKIVLNLLSNAFKFTFEGKITVALRSGTDHVELNVSDTGIGIPENELPRLFERFHRVPGVRGRTYEGSGIGLSLVQELVQLHGGTLRVASAEGQGSCFTVSIPVGSTHLPQNQIGATRTLTSTATGAAPYVEESLRWLPEQGNREWEIGNGEVEEPLTTNNQSLTIGNPTLNSPLPTPYPARILLVDDNADMRDYVRRLLSRDYEVEAVSDGLAALDAVQRHLPDLVLTDVMMPRLDGLGLLRSLRNDLATQNIPIILLSARAGEESRIEGLEAGADDYLIKPFCARELLARVRTNLELARLRRESVHSEIALRRSEEQLRVAQQAAGAGLWNWDIVADCVTWSEDYYQLYGLNPAITPSYENWIASIWEPDRERTDRAAREALECRTNLNVEFRVFHPIHGLRWLVALGQTFYDADGKPIRMTGIALDISDRKQAEVALRQSEAQARLAIKVGRLGTWRYYLQTDLVDLDKRMREIWGEPDDVQTIPLPRVIERIHPDDRERVAIAIGAALNPLSSGTYEIDYRIVWDDGTQRWVSANGQVQFEGEGESRQPVSFFGTALDISDQKRAEDELRRSEQRLQLAQQAGRIGTWEWNLLNNNASWSDGIWTLLGIEPGSITPNLESFVKFLHPDEQEQILQKVEIALAQGDDYYDEFRVIRQDGTICWFLSKGKVSRTQDGQPERLLGINIDITDRKQAEVALRASAERLSLAFAAAKLGDWSWDAQTDVVTFSQRAAEIFGIPPGPYMTWTRMQNLLHEADRERARLQVEIAIADHSDYDIEYRVIHADGTQRWVGAKGRVQFDATGQVVGMLGVVQDISDRKQAELEIQKFVSLADNSTEFIGMCDMNFVPFYVNEVGRQMVGLDDTRQYRETPVREFFFPEDQDFIINEFLPSVLREKRAEVEIRFRHFKTGEALWMIYNVFYITGENNQPIGLATVSRNITDRKRAEVALRESESRFRNIANHSPIMIWISAPDGAGVWFNQQWCEFTGQTLDEALGSGWLSAVHPEDAQSIETTCLQAHQRHEPVRLEYRLRRQDGEYRWVFDSAVARFDDTGVYLGYIGSIIDISDRKRAEAEVQRREREFRAVVENTPDLIIRYDRSGRHLYVNPSLERALGIPAEQFIGRTGIELGFTGATSQAWNGVLQQVFVTAQDSTYEFEFPNPEGERRSYQAYVVPELVQDGEVKTVLAVVRDVTAYKRTQEALRQSEERYRLALQAARMMTWSWDVKTDIIVRSQTACDVIGLTPEALQEKGSQGWQLVHPEDLAQHQATVQAAIDSKGSYISEFRMIRPDNGTIIWIEDRGKVNVDAMGHLISIEGTLFDISDRKQAQQELQQTLQTLSTLINASPLAIVVIEPNMTVQLWNPAAEKLFGWSEAEVLGQPIPIVPEEKRDECRQVREAVAKGEVFVSVETYRCKRDGATVIVSISAAPLYNEQGNLKAILLIFQDITQRQRAEEALRQSEERLRLALLVGKAGIWDWDIPHNHITWSEHIYEFHGLARGTFGGRVEDFAQLIHPDDQARVSEAIRQALEGETSYELEFRAVQPSGAVRWLSTTGGVIFDTQGHPIRMLGATRDITERKAVDEEREKLLLSEQQAREEAERANRIKDEFLAVLSHELRSPLNPILGWTKLLQSRTLDDKKTKHALTTIERNAKLQTQLIEDLLDVSRILQGKLVLNAAPVSLASTIDAAIETVRLAAEAKSIQIQQVLDLNIGQVMGESARLQQVIWNLLSNAVKFTPSGGMIEIRLEQINTDAQLRVRDTGIGITPEFLPHVFEYFRQEDGTTTRKFGGLGLGLAIVHHLVELHGGTVWAESPGEGLGATFTVRLPLMAAPTETLPDNSFTAPVAHLTGLRIVVVDDQPDIRDIVAFILEQAGAVVSVAASAPEALKLMEQSLPDVLVCDIGMPDMDGYMLMRLLRTLSPEQGGKIPAIALTAYAGEVDQQQALAAGFQQHLAKPVEPDELVRAIACLVEHPRTLP